MTDEHRDHSWSDRLRRFEDPSQSVDPRVVAVMDRFDVLARTHATVVAPPEFRAELRAQLVAIAPRLVAEHAPTSAPAAAASRAARAGSVLDQTRPSPRSRDDDAASRRPRRGLLAALRSVPIARPLAVVASLVTVLTLVLGGAVYLGRNAVPGDTLYGMKRAGERVELGLAGSDAERAQKYLEFATTRVAEARILVSRGSASAAGSGLLAGGALSPLVSGQITDVLASADGDTQSASRLLGGMAVSAASPAALGMLTAWAPGQLAQLAALGVALPSGTSAEGAVSHSVSLLRTATARAVSLQQRVDCKCFQNAPADSYGPVPTPQPATSSPGVTPTPGPTTAPVSPVVPGAPATTAPGGRPTTSQTQPGVTPPTAGVPGRLPVPLPTLPSAAPHPTASRSPGLCKVSILGVRLCPSPSS